jgi:hypothetical protein
MVSAPLDRRALCPKRLARLSSVPPHDATDNGQFDAPTQDFGSFQAFDLLFRSVFLSQEQAPNIEVEGTIRVFVADGQATGSLITSITATTCHGWRRHSPYRRGHFA